MIESATLERRKTISNVKTLEEVKAVKCNNGTFVSKETDELIVWKGIPYARKIVAGE